MTPFGHRRRLAGLRRFPAADERRFRAEVAAVRSRYFLRSALLGVALFDAYVLVDAALVPDLAGLSALLRLGVVTPVVLLGLLWRHRRLAAAPHRRVDGPLVAAAAVLCVGVLAVLQAQAPDALGGAYFMGAHVLVVYFVVLLRSDVREAGLVVGAMLATFAVQALVSPGTADVGSTLAALLAVAVSGLFGLVMVADIEIGERARFTAQVHQEGSRAERERLLAALEEANAALAEDAVRDELTGLLNRRGLARRLGASTGCSSCVVMLDVDHFKAYNDHFGHPEGDECLRRVAAAMSSVLRPVDVLARFGGEEFTVVLDDVDPVAARRTAERLREAVAELALPHPARPGGGTVTVSAGLAWGPSTTQALAAADAALYAAKAAGRNRVVAGAPDRGRG